MRGALLYDGDGAPSTAPYGGLNLRTRPGIVAPLGPLDAAAVIGVAIAGGGDV